MQFIPKLLLMAVVLSFTLGSSAAMAASKLELDTCVTTTLERLYSQQPLAKSLGEKAVAILVFPQIVKAGVGLGGEVGEGSLLVGGQSTQYYRTTSLSLGFQLGAQVRSEVIMFMTDNAYQGFINSNGWEAGVDGSIAIVNLGVGKGIDTHSMRDPIIGFLFGNKGLMYNLSLEGSKFWKISK